MGGCQEVNGSKSPSQDLLRPVLTGQDVCLLYHQSSHTVSDGDDVGPRVCGKARRSAERAQERLADMVYVETILLSFQVVRVVSEAVDANRLERRIIGEPLLRPIM